MFGPVRAVAIDDEPSHLLAITTGLTANGIPCMGYWYDRDANELRPQPPADGLPFVRLVFMDLNLAEQAGLPDTASLCSGVIDVLKQIISKDGGPYLLVFWTQVGTRVDDVRAMLYERLEEAAGVPCPIAVVELSKRPFLVGDPTQQDFKTELREFYAQLHGNIELFGNALKEVIGRDSQLSALSSWESRASDAAARAVNQVHACARDDGGDPRVTSDSIRKVLARIAVAAAGEASASDGPARALDTGMIDILVDQFGASVEDPDYKAAATKAIGESVKAAVVFQDEVQTMAALNTFFQVDKEITSVKAGDRGVVVSASPFKKNDLGFRPLDLLTEFLIPYELFPEGRRVEMKALLDAFRRSAEFVLVELGADCDHAQDTARTRRYLLGLEVPVMFSELLRFPENGKLRSEALQLLGPWSIDGKTLFFVVSCRRFWVWQDKKPHVQGKVKFRLRASLVNKLLHHYSTFHSRPGIIEFQTGARGGTFLYFAYGSNMLTRRLKSRAPSALIVGKGYVEGHRISFDKVSADGSGKCDIRPSDNPADRVHGVLFSIDVRDRSRLDREEGVGDGYRTSELQVATQGGVSTAVAFIAEDTNQQLRPYDWYKEIVVAGAVEHGLPDEYLETLRGVESQPDPDDHRSAKNRALLEDIK